jgi:hypothetical protein
MDERTGACVRGLVGQMIGCALLVGPRFVETSDLPPEIIHMYICELYMCVLWKEGCAYSSVVSLGLW